MGRKVKSFPKSQSWPLAANSVFTTLDPEHLDLLEILTREARAEAEQTLACHCQPSPSSPLLLWSSCPQGAGSVASGLLPWWWPLSDPSSSSSLIQTHL